MVESRRDFMKQSTLTLAGTGLGLQSQMAWAQAPGERPSRAGAVEILNPCNRVPLSFIIDDSTCLVNMAYFGIPQFAQSFPEKYKQDWRRLPREIPDAFVRKFGEWCAEHGVKGKYSIVPYPACTGWVDRFIPGWTEKELKDSLKLVRDLMLPDWDIHPEMVSHTRVIDTKTGRPYDDPSPQFMENWRWTDNKSVDELADYLSYALRILKNIDLPCEGITTPGGFGNRVLPELSQATLQSCRDVYGAEIPHYFRHLFTDERSVAPRVEYASGLDGDDPQCCVSIIGCTGDWFGGWDGLKPGSVDQFITKDLKGGRLPEVIERGEPAILVCHWPGIYFNGDEIGFNIFKEVYKRVHEAYDHLIWLKLSEIARYWAAKELTRVDQKGDKVVFNAPFASPRFTVKVAGQAGKPVVEHKGKVIGLENVKQVKALKNNTWYENGNDTIACFDLAKGETVLALERGEG
ncbi:twin-arginine translocation signal domain-containing protein [bacterium]|nr:twin-arginine translocation signal domain-containing protein [bacterium]